MKTLIVLTLTFAAQSAWTYPQMVRHGYARCTACHVSPNGGGILTQYGRVLSREVLSTWGREGEEQWHFGVGSNEVSESKFLYGGDYRSIQVHSETKQATVGRYIEMQEEIQLGWQDKNWSLVVRGASDTLEESRPWYVPGFHVNFSPLDKVQIRAGRFAPRFGINVAEHILSPKAAVNLGIRSERDLVETIYTSEKWDVSLSKAFGEFRGGEAADAVYSQVNWLPTQKSRLGLSYESKTQGNKRTSWGLHGLAAFSESTYLISEAVYQTVNGASSDSEGFYHFAKLGWEMHQGIHLLLIEDFKKSNLSSQRSSEDLWGLGFALFPRPHFELQGVWGKKRVLSRDHAYGDYAWLMFHFYL